MIAARAARCVGARGHPRAAASAAVARAIVATALAALAGSAGSLAAQGALASEPVFTSRGIADGLSHGTVHAVLQDRTGFLWIGTAGGLNRFDGHEFRSYTPRHDDSTSLGDLVVRALAEAADGLLWVGTERGGLNLFDPATGRAERFEMFELGPWALDALAEDERRRGRTVAAIAPLRDGSLVLATDLGLVHFDPATGARKRMDAGDIGPDPSAIVLCSLDGGDAFAGFPDGTFGIVRGPETPLDSRQLLFGSAIRSVRCSGDDVVYAGTADGDILRFDVRRRTVVHIARVRDDSGASLGATDVIVGPDGHLWVGTSQGLFGLAPHERPPSLRRVRGSPGSPLPDPQVTRLLTDATGMLWIGTWSGLANLHPLSLGIKRILDGTDDASGMLGHGVIAIEAADQNEFWLGTYDNGVTLLRSTNSADGWSLARLPVLSPLDDATVFDLTRGQGGELWIATLRDGMFRLDPARRTLTSIEIQSIDGRAATTALYSVFVDHAGDVWAGSLALGLLRYDRRSARFVEYRGPEQAWNFGSRYVWPIAEDRQGNLWIGAYNGGLSRIGADRHAFSHYPSTAGGLNDARILTVFPDSRGAVWIGTQGGGLIRFRPDSSTFDLYTTHEGLPHDNVEAIVEDGSGFLWISTHDGLARFDPATEEFRVLSAAAGLTGDRFFANSVHQDAGGVLFFGGPAGVTVFDPARTRTAGLRPPIALTRFRIRGDEVSLDRMDAERGLDLAPDENFFTFEFAAMDFRDPALNRYRYRLIGLDETWNESGALRVANYTSVPPGRYTFLVEATTSEAVRSTFSIPIRVRAHYYQTGWFRALVVAAALALLSGLYAYRMRELQRRQELRLGIAGRLHDDIGANLSTIVLKADMIRGAAALGGRGAEQLIEVGQLARETALKVRETAWVVNTQYDTLAGLVTKMRDTTDTMLGGHTEYCFVEPKGLPERPLDMERRQAFYLMFKEALHNILKHASASSVEISVLYDPPVLTCVVRDNGSGFDPSVASDGSGLNLMKKRTERFDGQLSIAGQPGGGTTVSFSMKLK